MIFDKKSCFHRFTRRFQSKARRPPRKNFLKLKKISSKRPFKKNSFSILNTLKIMKIDQVRSSQILGTQNQKIAIFSGIEWLLGLKAGITDRYIMAFSVNISCGQRSVRLRRRPQMTFTKITIIILCCYKFNCFGRSQLHKIGYMLFGWTWLFKSEGKNKKWRGFTVGRRLLPHERTHAWVQRSALRQPKNGISSLHETRNKSVGVPAHIF